MRLLGTSSPDDSVEAVRQAALSFQGVTTSAGNAFGTTLVCTSLTIEPSYQGLMVKVLSGNAAGQARPIAVHVAGTNTLTVAAPFTDNAGAVVQITAGTSFCIMSLGGGGGAPPPPPPGPSVGLWMFGVCDPAMVASTTAIVCPNLAGFNDDLFNNEFWIQIIHNFGAPGTAPEREIRRITDYAGATGTFTTDAFSANVEANDILCLFHESIMGMEIVGFGTLDTSSTTLPADSTRAGLYAWENNNYFKGCLLMPTEGACRMQAKRIIAYTSATGVFQLDEAWPFTSLPGAVDYVIIRDMQSFVPQTNTAANYQPSEVIGNKADDPSYDGLSTRSLVRHIKGLVGTKIVATGTADAGSDANTLVDAARAEIDEYWNGLTLMMITGANAGLTRPIVDYDLPTTTIEVRPAFPAAIVATDVYVILTDYDAPVPVLDGVENYQPRDVIGNKASAAVYLKDGISDIVRYLKGLLDATITAYGMADAGSDATKIRDAARTEANDWWNGQTILMLNGLCALQKRPIVDFLAASDDIMVAPDWDAVPGAGDEYIILAHYNQIVPRTADSGANALTSDVVGRKDDTALFGLSDTSSLMRYAKGLIASGVAISGSVSDIGPAVTDFDTNLTEATNDHYNGMLLMFIEGACMGQAHLIDDYVGGSKNVSFATGDQWTDVPANGNRFVILPAAGAYLAKIFALLSAGGVCLTTFGQETAAATDVNGTTWKDLLDKSVLASDTKICGFTMTVAGAWAGNAKIRIVSGAGTKLWPFGTELIEGTDWNSGVQQTLAFEVIIPAATGYKVQFRSSNGADGAGETLQLNNLDVIALT